MEGEKVKEKKEENTEHLYLYDGTTELLYHSAVK